MKRGWTTHLLLFLAAFLAGATLVPSTLSFEDSPEFAAAAATFGLPHPAGYPLHVALGRLLSLIPFGSVPWRVGLLSALCSAAALALLWRTASRATRDVHSRYHLYEGVLMALILTQVALTPTWVAAAIVPEVNALFLLSFVAIGFVCAGRGEGARTGVLLAFLFGLALSAHLYLAAAALPFFVGAYLYAVGREGMQPANLVRAFTAFLLGLLPYAFFPLMAKGGYAFVSLAETGRADWMLRFLDRSLYADAGTGGFAKMSLVLSYASHLAREVGWPLLLLAAIGAWSLWRSGRRALFVWTVGGIGIVPVVLTLQRVDWSGQMEYLSRAFALVGIASVGLLAAIGATALLRMPAHATSSRVHRLFPATFLVCASLSVLLALPLAARPARIYAHPYPDHYVRAILASLPQDAVLVAYANGLAHDTILFGLAYLQSVERLRPDVTIVNDSIARPFVLMPSHTASRIDGARADMLRRTLADPRFAARPVYATFAPEAALSGASSTDGVVYRIFREGEIRVILPPAAPLALPTSEALAHPAIAAIASHALYARAARAVEEGRTPNEVLPTLVHAMTLDTIPASPDYLGFVAHRASLAR